MPATKFGTRAKKVELPYSEKRIKRLSLTYFEGVFMDVTVIGCGYVGLVTGTCLASIGHTVRGVEKDAKKLKTLQDGHCPIFEPGLQELMQENYASGQLQFTDNVKAAVKDAEVVFLCVGTPSKARRHRRYELPRSRPARKSAMPWRSRTTSTW